MKLSLLAFALMFSLPSWAMDTSALGSATEYSCIVEIKESQPSETFYMIYQTCDSKNTLVVDTVDAAKTSVPKLQIEIISAMRTKGMPLVSQSSTTYTKGPKRDTTTMVFQKRVVE